MNAEKRTEKNYAPVEERGGRREWVCVPLETVDEDLDKDASVAGDLVVDVRVNSTHLSFESQVLVSTWSKH